VRFGTCITDILSSDVGTLGFSHTAVSVFDELLTRCCKQPKAKRTQLMVATVSAPLASIARRRGLTKSQVHYALLELAGHPTVQVKGKRVTATMIGRQPVIRILEQTSTRSDSGRFGKADKQQFELLNPKRYPDDPTWDEFNPEPLKTYFISATGEQIRDTPNILQNNGLSHFRMAAAIRTQAAGEQRSVKKMENAEYGLYRAILRTSNRKSTNAWGDREATLRKHAGLSAKVFDKYIDSLKKRGLIRYETTVPKKSSPTSYSIELLDPDTGDVFAGVDAPDEDNARNWVSINPVTGKEYRFKSQLDRTDREDTKRWLRSHGGNDVVIRDCATNWVRICCPFGELHKGGQDRHPSCGVTPNGFRCGTCGSKGNLLALAKKFGWIEFVPPPNTAIEEYIYYDRDRAGVDRIRYRKARYPDKPDGERVYCIERKPQGRWKRAMKTKQTLYNKHLIGDALSGATTIFLCEGEKDSDSATNLHFTDGQGNEIIGTTSGGAQSWKPEFAGPLKGKRVVFLPDDDEPGRQYRDTVLASLGEVGVAPTVVSFSGSGCKDLTEYLSKHSHEAFYHLLRKHGVTVAMPPIVPSEKDVFEMLKQYEESVETVGETECN
jgi:hypothetical protein